MLNRNVLLFVAGAVLSLSAAASADPLQIKEGYNFLMTAPGSYTTLSIPAGFFGEKGGAPSDAIVNREVRVEGRPIGSLGLSPASNIIVGAGNCHSGGGHYHCHENSDTLENIDTISRVSSTSLNEVGSSGTVTLQFVALSLQTPKAAPLQVTFGGKNPTAYNLILTLDSKPQTVGSIVLTRTGAKDGRMRVNLPVDFRVSFTGGGASQTIGPVSVRAVLRSDDNTFSTK